MRASGAESCPAPSAMRAAVARRLGRDPFERDAAVSFEVVVEPRSPGWAARIVAQGAGQSPGHGPAVRELTSEAAACASLADAVSLAVALAIDPVAVERTARMPAPTPALPTPAAAQPQATLVAAQAEPLASSTPEASLASTRSGDRDSGAIDARALASLGLLPGGALGFGLAGEARFAERLAAVVGLDFWPERETAGAGGHFAFGLTAASLGLCADLVRASMVGLGLCGAGMLGSVHAVVLDLPPTGAGDRLWAAVRAGAQLRMPETTAVRASFGVEAIVPFTRHRFTVRNEPGEVFRQAPVALHASLGVGYRF